jgi:hypothetical protein
MGLDFLHVNAIADLPGDAPNYPAPGFVAIRFGNGTFGNYGELDMFCGLPISCFYLSIFCMYDFLFSIFCNDSYLCSIKEILLVSNFSTKPIPVTASSTSPPSPWLLSVS